MPSLKWTKEKIKEYIENEGYEFIEFIENSGLKSKILIWCKNENHKCYKVKFENFKNRNSRCPHCFNDLRRFWNKDEICKFVSDNNHKLIDFIKFDYANSNMRIMCDNNHIFESTLSTYRKNKGRCPFCSHNRIDINYIKELFNNEGYTLITDEYVDKYSELIGVCNNSHKFISSWDKWRHGYRCNECLIGSSGYNKRLTIDYINNYVNQFNYTLCDDSDEYINEKTVLKLLCDEGCIFYVSWNNFKSGARCLHGKFSSKGEKRVNDFLVSKKIDFNSQVKYDGLLGLKNGKLSYDFYLPKYNMLIEYQGEYHDGTAKNQSDEDFKVQQEHDKRKKEYAINNNINLLEIWYWDFNNIENILIKELNLNIKLR